MNSAVRIHLDLREPERQTVQVSLSWVPETLHQTWQMPVWTPGSYTVRDHVQHLHSLRLECEGGTVPIRRVAPSRWQADLTHLAPLTLRYAVEARHLTVRTCHLDPDLASLCLSGLAMEVQGCRWSPHQLTVSTPESWSVHVPLDHSSDGWSAADFDALVDSPVHAGPFEARLIRVLDHQHQLLLIGAPPAGWPPSFLDDVVAVCEATCRLMGTPPPAGDNYQLVLILLEQGYGGLEHDHGTVLHYNWAALQKPEGYRQLLQLIGHEYLHQWNVRRLRPAELRPYHYGSAVISEGLWFAEGITSYFDLALTMLAGRSDRPTFLADLGEELSRVQLTPGRRVQSLSDSAREAWVKLYKATATSRDTQVSYYRLGAATAFCLDVRLRRRNSSLASLLRRFWGSHGITARGYHRTDIQALLAEFDPSLSDELATWLDQPDSLPLDACTQELGLRLDPEMCSSPDSGMTLRDDGGAVLVSRVRPDGPAAKAALVPDDEVIAVQGRRLRRMSDLPGLLLGATPVPIVYARRGCLAETQLIPDEAVDRWRLSWDPGASLSQRALRDQWFQIL